MAVFWWVSGWEGFLSGRHLFPPLYPSYKWLAGQGTVRPSTNAVWADAQIRKRIGKGGGNRRRMRFGRQPEPETNERMELGSY